MTTHPQIEAIYEELAKAIDMTEAAAGPAATPVYLAKLVLALAHAMDDPDKVMALITECRQGL
ncbi:MAG: hypothetical protein B7X55_02080 [Rhodobacterales bacterium 34-62-10]|nr:MAG: hypothetical protein B7X55_02080 [Rhodobacterales bacterium 34-62-10]